MKVRNNISMVVSLVMMMALSCCTRDHLYYETVSRHQVQLNIDWSQTNFAPESKGYDEDNKLNGVTIFAFDSATHKLVTELPPNANWQSPRLSLSPGTYDLIVINDSRAELPAINFSIGQAFDDFKAYIAVDTVYSEYPDYLAVSAVRNVQFLPPMSNYHYYMPDDYYQDIVTQKISTVQKSVTKKVNIRVYVKGMNYCKGMLPSFITGLSKSVNLATRKTGKDETVYAFNLINREFRNGSYTEAMLTQSFNSFGFSDENLKEGTRFELTLNFVLIDNSVHTVKTDVTQQFEDWLKEHSIDLGLDLDLDIDVAMEVELPPTVEKPEEAGGMAPETVPWNDIIQNITM